MVARDQHLCHQPGPVVLDRTAERLDFGRHVLFGGRRVTEPGQAVDLARGVGKRRGGRFGRAE